MRHLYLKIGHIPKHFSLGILAARQSDHPEILREILRVRERMTFKCIYSDNNNSNNLICDGEIRGKSWTPLLASLGIVATLLLPMAKRALLGEIEVDEEYLKELISKSSVMLFMKGTPSNPRCGFSSRICKLLVDHKIRFGTYDILQNAQVREKLKEFSNWKTYPQLYINGELIGGLDIVEEMAKDGSLMEIIPSTSRFI